MATPARKTESLSVFPDKAAHPTEARLRAALAAAAPLWDELVAHCASAYPPSLEQWNHAGKSFGWSLRVKQRERIVLYLTPQRGSFLVGLVLGAKAVAAAKQSELPAAVLDAIANARMFAEGTGFRVAVRKRADLDAIRRLVALKMERPATR